MPLNKQSRKVLKRLRRNFGGRGSKIVGGTQQYLICPIHFFERTASLSINLEHGYCHCFGCGWAGRLTDLARIFPHRLAKNALLNAQVEFHLEFYDARERILKELPRDNYDSLFTTSLDDNIPF